MALVENPKFETPDGRVFRIYDETAEDRIQKRVRNFYYKQHQNQTVQLGRELVCVHNSFITHTISAQGLAFLLTCQDDDHGVLGPSHGLRRRE